MAEILVNATPALSAASAAAFANATPNAELRAQMRARDDFGLHADKMAARVGSSYGSEQEAMRSTVDRRPRPLISTSAASTPSADVPDISPITSMDYSEVKL